MAGEAVWPFAPRVDMTEPLEWLTDVIRTKEGEQRIALRATPRRSFDMTHILNGPRYAAAQEIVRGAQWWLVPDWAHFVRVPEIDPGATVAIACNTACLDFRLGDQAILWASPEAWEVVLVASVAEDGITVSDVLGTWRSVRVMPLRNGVAPGGITAERITGEISQIKIKWLLDDASPDAFPSSTYPQYRGMDVMADSPKLGGGLEEAVVWEHEVMDSQLGPVVPVRVRYAPDVSVTVRWRVFNACGAKALRGWLHSRRGRQKAFWLSSRGRDFVPAEDISALATSITVSPMAGTGVLARSEFDIEAVNDAGVAVRAWVTGSHADGANVVLELSDAFGVSMPASSVRRISLLRCVRFDADRVELIHRGVGIVEVAVPCIEAPVP